MTVLRKVSSILVLFAASLGWTSGPADAIELLVSDPGANAVLRYNVETRAFDGVFASGGGLTEPSGLASSVRVPVR